VKTRTTWQFARVGRWRGACLLAASSSALYWAVSCSLLAPADDELMRLGSLPDASQDGPAEAARDATVDREPDAPDACDELTCPPNSQCQIVSGLPGCACSSGFKGEAGACARHASCDELHRAEPALASGAYLLAPPGSAGDVEAYCEMSVASGGWTLILNQNTTFDVAAAPSTSSVCYDSVCTSAAYKLVRMRADVMLDVSDTPISGSSFSARIILANIDGRARGKTLHQLFTTGPYYLDDDLNSNVTVRVPDGRACANALPWETANLLCDVCHSDGGCGQAVLVFGDAHPGCAMQAALTFAIGAAYSSTRPWHQCAGWPEAANYSNYNYLPDNYRIWLR